MPGTQKPGISAILFYQIHKDHITLSVKVLANAPKNEFKIHSANDQRLIVKIRAVREKGKANEELIAYFSSIFEIPKKDVQLIRGGTSPLKTIALYGVNLEKLQNVLGI